MKFVVCVSRADCGDLSTDDLTLGRLYEVQAPADSRGMLRIIDDSGEDYLYPESLFEAVELAEKSAANRFDFSDLAGRLQWRGDAVAAQRASR